MTIFTELASKHLLWFTKKVSQEGLDDSITELAFTKKVSQEGLDDNIHRTSFKTFTVVRISQEGLDDNIHRTSFKTFTVVHKKSIPRRFR